MQLHEARLMLGWMKQGLLCRICTLIDAMPFDATYDSNVDIIALTLAMDGNEDSKEDTHDNLCHPKLQCSPEIRCTEKMSTQKLVHIISRTYLPECFYHSNSAVEHVSVFLAFFETKLPSDKFPEQRKRILMHYYNIIDSLLFGSDIFLPSAGMHFLQVANLLVTGTPTPLRIAGSFFGELIGW